MLAINAQDDTGRIIIPIELFCESGILVCPISLGKDGSAGWWCTYCKLMKPDFQINGHDRGDSWTINGIAIHAEGVDYLSQERDRMGVNKNPFSN